MKQLFIISLLLSLASSGYALSWTDVAGYWKFDEGSGAYAYDASGNNNTGTLYGNTSWTAGKHGNGLYFDGSGDYVQIADSTSLSPTQQITIASWVYTPGNFGYWTIVGKDNAYQNQLLGSNGIQNSIYYGGWSEKNSSAVLTAGAWNHVVITFNGSTQSIYANGTLILQGAFSAGINNSADTMYIGSWKAASEFFYGIIDEVSVWNKALSSTEVSTFYTTYNGNVSNFVPEASSFLCLFLVVGAGVLRRFFSK
ncbi:MAG: LamG domain-containing protein [Candidatus Brocadiae bacterium]|nr:LamG domain-containing protein [Candidatus Brocadiia bacterium]